jgi:MoaA/NifB/PqqE/SkfB family radical SAM enzyme
MKARLMKRVRGARVDLKHRISDEIQQVKRTMDRLGIVPPPFRIQIDITDRCNFRCPTCSKWQAASARRELRAKLWREIFAKVGGLSLLKEVTITGGEPFMRHDLFEILQHAREEGLYVVVISNGSLVDRHVLSELDRIGVNRLMVSLNSLRAAVHDESRSFPGSFEHLMGLVKSWQGLHPLTQFCIATVITEENCTELVPLAHFTKENGLNGIIYQVLAPVEAHYPFSEALDMPPSIKEWYEHNPLWVKQVGVFRREIGRLLELKRKGFPIINPTWQLRAFPLYYESPEAVIRQPCLGTLSTLYLDPFGDIRLCYGYPPIGNALDEDPKQVWRNTKARRVRQAAKQCDRLCRLLNNNL